jgi:hypothetical protein
MFGDEKILEGSSDLDSEIAIGGRDGDDVLALAVTAQLVAEEGQCFENLIHEAGAHGFRQVVEEALRA